MGSLVPTAPHPKRDSGYSREESQTREHPQRAVWERAPGKVLEGLWSPQDQTSPGCTSIGGQKAELRRGGSGRSPRSKARGEGPGPSPPLHLDLTKLSLECGPEAPGHAVETPPHSPLYADPYTPPATSHHKITDVRGLDEVSALP